MQDLHRSGGTVKCMYVWYNLQDMAATEVMRDFFFCTNICSNSQVVVALLLLLIHTSVHANYVFYRYEQGERYVGCRQSNKENYA